VAVSSARTITNSGWKFGVVIARLSVLLPVYEPTLIEFAKSLKAT
jgi:hypothetical protein